MKSFLGRITGIGEIDPDVIVMQRLIFTLICTLLLLKPTANAIFLSNLGIENLPIAYVALAILALIVTAFYSRFISAFSTKKLFIKTSIINIILLILIGIMLSNHWSKSITAFVFYLFISIFGILSASQFWIIANQLFNAREARKYFGFIGSGAIAGGIAGGYLASIISSATQSEYIPFAGAVILMYSIHLMNKLQKSTADNHLSGITESDTRSNFLGPFKLVREIKHLKYLAFLLAISVFVAKLIDYQFGYFATRIYIDEEDLTQFYGFWMSTFNIISLLIQLFLTNRVVGKLGVGYSIMLLPAMILLNATFLIIFPIIGLVVSLRLFDAGMKQSINKASVELMMLPVPQDIKLKTKTFLDVFVDSLATGISGIILIFVVKTLDLPNQVISFVILFGSFLWLYFGNKMRIEYKSIFRQSLKIQSEQIANTSTAIIDDYHQMLRSGSDYQKIKAISFLKNHLITGLEEDIRMLLKHSNEKIIVATLDMIMYKEIDFYESVIPLLNHKSQNVKIDAFDYLINHQEKLEPNYLITLLNEGEDQLKIAAIAAYAKEFQNNRSVLRVLRINDRINTMLQDHQIGEGENLFMTIGLLKAISIGKFSNHYHFINQCLKHPSHIIRQHGINAAGETRSSAFLKLLMSYLEGQETPIVTYSAIAKYGFKRVEKIMQKYTAEENLPFARKIPFILKLIPSQSSVDLLLQMAEYSDLSLRNNAITSLNDLLENYPLLKVDDKVINRILLNEAKYNNMLLNALVLKEDASNVYYKKLVELLKKRIDENLVAIFKLLHIKYPPDDYLELYQYVTGSDQSLRDNAIEYLENTLGPSLKSTIISLIEYSVLNHEFHIQNKFMKISDNDIREFLINNEDEDIRSTAKAYFSNKDSFQ
ncbi:MAG: hypothetical protein HKN68_16425 [Saprospiraceae bacterium]|nr:hypothetical protein [Saprospiraceae bacterium]